MMNPLTLHQSSVIREVYRELGREDEAEERVRRWYHLRDTVGSVDEPTHQRVRMLKQYSRARIYSEVLGDDRVAIRLFEEKEARGWSITKNLKIALEALAQTGRVIAIVSESTSAEAVNAIIRFLLLHRLGRYFEQLITPAGRFNFKGELVGPEFVGKTKRSGEIYEVLGKYLGNRGIVTSSAMMIGDDPVQDIENAKQKGFVTVQYTGVVHRGRSERADFVIEDWAKLPNIV